MNSRICVVIPTFNNAATLPAVLDGVLHHVDDVIVVDDGSTDATPQLLAERSDWIDVVTLSHNRGKGAALVAGFRRAMDRGFSHAVTLDSDGHPAAIIVGNRFAPSHFTEENASNMNARSKFANRLSNFWFRVQTGEALPDTQTGFRAYPHRLLRFLGIDGLPLSPSTDCTACGGSPPATRPNSNCSSSLLGTMCASTFCPFGSTIHRAKSG